MKADKKLGNVLASWTWRPTRTSSYSELYRRRFDISRYSQHIRSPEGSTLSICGDSQLEELSLDEDRSSLPATSRDDSSELSFYRRFIEGHAEFATRTALSCVLASDPRLANNTVFPGVSRAAGERCIADGKPKGPTYRPYTIEEYRSLSVSRPDRSLGPNKDEVQMKKLLG
ncbi:uncharacterized protein LOC116849053 isoform X2 [Odontomachus brunneus]|uniref:uncharacterized protein LOC116849053 isoform X2 n=1 Tax=Odontomachus brunneus TaxID=486640 RepID=UPI0013F2235A|nr:uncharacterized protein LOC116849053 isoform X2 [Odontomachus brunneus]